MLHSTESKVEIKYNNIFSSNTDQNYEKGLWALFGNYDEYVQLFILDESIIFLCFWLEGDA